MRNYIGLQVGAVIPVSGPAPAHDEPVAEGQDEQEWNIKQEVCQIQRQGVTMGKTIWVKPKVKLQGVPQEQLEDDHSGFHDFKTPPGRRGIQVF